MFSNATSCIVPPGTAVISLGISIPSSRSGVVSVAANREPVAATAKIVQCVPLAVSSDATTSAVLLPNQAMS